MPFTLCHAGPNRDLRRLQSARLWHTFAPGRRSVIVPKLSVASSLRLAFAAAFVPALLLAQTASLVAKDAWVRKPPAGETAAVYFVLTNNGAQPATVIGVTSPIAESAMIHETSIVDGQSRMRMKDRILVPPGKSVTFGPEGLHVMFVGFRYDVKVGDNVPLTLQLEGGGKLAISAVVRPLDGK
jgi:copper(I)-binding protein